ncbi:MAG: hypothetical protein ACI4EA_08075 [Candidatus Ornithomonoglobus sp.]
MTERERLIELCDTNNGWVDEVQAEEFADYLLANGVIVPPCKVGGTVYRVTPKNGTVKIEPIKVEGIHIKDYGIDVEVKLPQGNFGNYMEYNFGKTVFLTREEAERALKEAQP